MPTTQRFRSQPQIWLAVAAAVLAAIVVLSPAPTRRMLSNSAILAAGATAIALPLGTLLAVLLVKVDLPGRRAAAACLGVLLFLPLFVQLSGWDAALGKLGWITLTFGSAAQPWLDDMRAAIFIHGLAAVPWVALIVGLGLRRSMAGRRRPHCSKPRRSPCSCGSRCRSAVRFC